MRTLQYLLLSLLLSLQACAATTAAEPTPTRDPLANIQQGAPVAIGPEQYVQLPDVRARQATDASPSAQAQPLGAVQPPSLLQQKGRWRIEHYRSQRQAYQAADLALPGQPVLWNPRTRQFAIVTGELVVTLVDSAQAQALADDYGLQLSGRFSQLRQAFYRAPADQVLELLERLAQDTRVSQVRPGLLEHLRQPY